MVACRCRTPPQRQTRSDSAEGMPWPWLCGTSSAPCLIQAKGQPQAFFKTSKAVSSDHNYCSCRKPLYARYAASVSELLARLHSKCVWNSNQRSQIASFLGASMIPAWNAVPRAVPTLSLLLRPQPSMWKKAKKPALKHQTKTS